MALPHRRVVLFDSEGDIMMGMGVLATIAEGLRARAAPMSRPARFRAARPTASSPAASGDVL